MSSLSFIPSRNFTLGVELEIQLIDPSKHDLVPRAKELLQLISDNSYYAYIKPEVTQSMLEINSSVYDTPDELYAELLEVQRFLAQSAKKIDIRLAGGGAHPFQMWNERKIYPTQKFKKTAVKYGYLAKMFTVFGLHIHIGCNNADDALYLTHALARFIPHFIAISASSPFCQGVDTEFDSARANVVNAFPLNGIAPTISSWSAFTSYIQEMQSLGLIKNIDNFYWDIRPRPEFGTVELRICDMPLTVERVVTIAAFAQTLAHYILSKRELKIYSDKYHAYQYNRFQASRHGFNAKYIDLDKQVCTTLFEELLTLCAKLEPHAEQLNNSEWHFKFMQNVVHKYNDACRLRDLFNKTNSLEEVVQLQSQLWMGDTQMFSVCTEEAA